MEELRRVAWECYGAAPSTPRDGLRDVVEGAYDYMRPDDGLAIFSKFSDYMTKVGRLDLANRAFFRMLASDGDDKLNGEDVVLLAYIVFIDQRICISCASLIGRATSHYICATCVHNNEQPYVLCLDCHQNIRDFVLHEHKDFVFNVPVSEPSDREKLTREASSETPKKKKREKNQWDKQQGKRAKESGFIVQ